jgi:hypothetical protein
LMPYGQSINFRACQGNADYMQFMFLILSPFFLFSLKTPFLFNPLMFTLTHTHTQIPPDQ